MKVFQEQLEEATETIHAIRTGQVDAIVVRAPEGGNSALHTQNSRSDLQGFYRKNE
jgi:hypothetical protein